MTCPTTELLERVLAATGLPTDWAILAFEQIVSEDARGVRVTKTGWADPSLLTRIPPCEIRVIGVLRSADPKAVVGIRLPPSSELELQQLMMSREHMKIAVMRPLLEVIVVSSFGPSAMGARLLGRGRLSLILNDIETRERLSEFTASSTAT